MLMQKLIEYRAKALYCRTLIMYAFFLNRLKYNQVAHPYKTLYVKISSINSKLAGDLDLRKGSIPSEIKDGNWEP